MNLTWLEILQGRVVSDNKHDVCYNYIIVAQQGNAKLQMLNIGVWFERQKWGRYMLTEWITNHAFMSNHLQFSVPLQYSFFWGCHFFYRQSLIGRQLSPSTMWIVWFIFFTLLCSGFLPSWASEHSPIMDDV